MFFFSSAEKKADTNAVDSSKNDALMFDKFDITHVLKHGEALLGSSGQEYDVFDEELLGRNYTIIPVSTHVDTWLLNVDIYVG